MGDTTAGNASEGSPAPRGETKAGAGRSRRAGNAPAGLAVGGTADPDRALDAEFAALSYEEALEALETIIDRVDHGEVGLEATLAEYRRGKALLRRCQSVLDTAEQEIKRLSLADLEAQAHASGPSDAGSAAP
jgi:exodeoxyribonuclease VII small subunit